MKTTEVFVIVTPNAEVVSDELYMSKDEAQIIADKNWLGSHFVTTLSEHLQSLHTWYEAGIERELRD